MHVLQYLIQSVKNAFTPTGILEKVDALHTEAQKQAADAAQRAQEFRIESERLYAEAEAAQGEANRLETLSRNLAEVIGLVVEDGDIAPLPDANPIGYPELHQ